jgi:hypothetical protein
VNFIVGSTAEWYHDCIDLLAAIDETLALLS